MNKKTILFCLLFCMLVISAGMLLLPSSAKEDTEQTATEKLEDDILEEAVYKKLTEEDEKWIVEEAGTYDIRIYDGSTKLIIEKPEGERKQHLLDCENNGIEIELFTGDVLYLKDSDEVDRCAEIYQIE